MQTEIIEADLDLENWITGTSYAQAKVTIYRNPALMAEYEPLLERIAELEEQAETATDEALSGEGGGTSVAHLKEASLGEVSELDRLYEQAEALHARFEADAEVWTLRALDPIEIDELREQVPQPIPPKPLAVDADDAARAEHQKARNTYKRELAEWGIDYNLKAIARSVLSVIVAGKQVPTPDEVMLTALPKRPGGPRHVETLARAIVQVSNNEVTLLAPHRKRA